MGWSGAAGSPSSAAPSTSTRGGLPLSSCSSIRTRRSLVAQQLQLSLLDREKQGVGFEVLSVGDVGGGQRCFPLGGILLLERLGEKFLRGR